MSRLRYEPDTGDFYWLNGPRKGRKAGGLYGNGYHYIDIDGTGILAHRLAFLFMEGKMPVAEVDHINGIPTDNRWTNLRHASRGVNSRNMPIRVDNTSGLGGVCWDKSYGMWLVRISHNRRNIHVGRYQDFFEACCARKSAEIRYGYHKNHGRSDPEMKVRGRSGSRVVYKERVYATEQPLEPFDG